VQYFYVFESLGSACSVTRLFFGQMAFPACNENQIPLFSPYSCLLFHSSSVTWSDLPNAKQIIITVRFTANHAFVY